MPDALTQTVGGVYFLKNGIQRDPFGLSNFTPASNVNRIEVYLEDGVSTNVVQINYKADNKGYPSSVFFPLYYVETVVHTVSGEVAPRTFAKYWALVPPQVLQWNANGSAPMSIAGTVVQTAGDSLLGIYQYVSTLEDANPASEELYDDGSVAYVMEVEGENNYGFYMVAYDSGTDTYSWERIETPVNQVDGVESKQYNIVGMQIQKGNLPRPTSSVSITAEYIRLILTYIAQVNGVATDNALAITILNNFMNDLIAGTQDLGYDNTISGLVATTIKDAIDELDSKKIDKDFTAYTELTTDLSDDDYVIVRDVSNNQTKKTKVSTLRQFETDTYEYGVRWIEGQSSPTLERVKRVNGELFIGSATNLVANIGIDDEVVVNSFDNIGIFNRPRVNIGGNTFVQIPKYYISEYLANESGTIYHYLWVCDKKLSTYNYRLPIRFDNGDGTEKDYTYIGAYEAYVNASGVAQSVSGVLPTTSITRNNARISARKNDGDGTNTDSAYGIKDLAEHYDLLQVPFYIEFATLNSQSIFRGVVDLTFEADTVADSTVANTAIIANNANFEVDMTIYLSTGTYHTITQIDVDTPIAGQTTITFDGDTVTPLTGVNLDPRQYKTGYTDSIVATSGCYKANDGKTPIKYRGVENFNGNVWEFTDGGKVSNWYLWVTENPSDYDDVSSDVNGDYALPFVKLNYQNALSNGYISELGYDDRFPFARLPIEVGGGSGTYYADYYYQNPGDRSLLVGGSWHHSSNAGLADWGAYGPLSYTNHGIGFRLSHRP